MGKADRVSVTKPQDETKPAEVKVTKTDKVSHDLVTTTFKSMGEVSDGYHTFNELYKCRMLLNAALFNGWYADYQERDVPVTMVLKSRKHSDGEKPFGGGWFVVSAELPTGQITFHYENKYWDLFKIGEAERAPAWDGHTAQQAMERLEKYVAGDWE